MIEENLTSLQSILRLLVPDPFECFGDVDAPSTSSNDPREHGFLFGTSSGFAGSRNTVSFSLEVAPTGREKATDDDEETGIPRLRLQLTDDIRILRDSGCEFVNLATHKHKSILTAYIEVSLQTKGQLRFPAFLGFIF